MEPVSLIVSGLVAGASEAVKDTAAQAVKDAYAALRRLLGRRTAEAPHIAEMADRGAVAALREALARAGLADDDELVRAARRVLTLVDPGGARTGKYDVTVSGGKGVVIGDHARVEMTFEDGD